MCSRHKNPKAQGQGSLVPILPDRTLQSIASQNIHSLSPVHSAYYELRSHPFKTRHFVLIRNAFPSKIAVMKPYISKIPFPKTEGVRMKGPVDVLSNFLTNCFKSVIALAAIYISIYIGCWKKTYLEPISNDFEDPKVEMEEESPEWQVIANYIAGRASCGTRIRYCTAKELKLMTGRRLCECPNSSEPFKAGKFLGNIFRNALKAAVVLGVAYVTYDLGFWGVPKDTEATFASLCEAMPCRPDPCRSYEFKTKSRECEEALELLKVSPHDPCKCDHPIPVDMEKCCYKMKQVWNHTVIFIFEGIANAPDNVINFMVRKWREFLSTECDPCRSATSAIGSEFASKECELLDDYEEKYSKEPEDECKEVQEQAKIFMEAEEEAESKEDVPPCTY